MSAPDLIVASGEPLTTGLALHRLLFASVVLGYAVDLTSRQPVGARRNPDRIGWTDYARRYVWVEPGNDPVTQALILLHELGHALAADRMGFGPKAGRPRRTLARLRTGEERAYLYGWAIAVRTEMAGPGKVTRQLWRAFNGIGSQP